MSAPEMAPTIQRKTKPLVFGAVGLGGYAWVICEQLMASMRKAHAPVRLTHVYEPNLAGHEQKIAQLARADVQVLSSFDELLNSDVEAVWLPLPIHLHRSYTIEALRAGKAVMCEKPAAGCIDDVDAMIAAREAIGLPVAVGFQLLYDPKIVELKQRILGGLIGKISSASLQVCWPRDRRYYDRNNWAGAVKRDGVWVMDSPAMNAMAHYITLALYLLGPEGQLAASPTNVEAELYRVNDIENYDTCSIRFELPGGAKLLVLMTHASDHECGPSITMTGERGTIVFRDMEEVIVQGKSIRLAGHEQLHESMHREFAKFVRDPSGDANVATLEMARAHTLAVNGASEAAIVQTIDPKFIGSSMNGDGKLLNFLPDIQDVFEQCAAGMKMLHESHLVPWSVPGQRKDLRGYKHFLGPRIH